MKIIIFVLVLLALGATFPIVGQERTVENGRYLGSILMCDDGFRNVGGRCEALPAVTNGRYLGPMLMCDDGFRNVGGRCEPLPSAANGRYLGSLLVCDDGYKNVGGRCEFLPSVTNGRYLGSLLVCDDGFKNIGGRCESLPPATNGRYLGSMLVCDDGYKNIGTGCEALPYVSNGSYVGSFLLCNDGFKNLGGKCERLSPAPNATYFGDVLICLDGYVFEDGSCVRSTLAAVPANRRLDPILVDRSRQAPVPADPYVSLGPYFSSQPSPQLRSGSTYDASTGNTYRWIRQADGSTIINGMNSRTGSFWKTTIRQDGSMTGYDKNMNSWTYNSRTGFYMNYGTGKICTGKGTARTCF